MIKPDWSKAPEWAEWWAADRTGISYYYAIKPFEGVNTFIAKDMRYEVGEIVAGTVSNWRITLTQRPQSTTASKLTLSLELTHTELSVLITALEYAKRNIDMKDIEPLQRKLLETYKEVNK